MSFLLSKQKVRCNVNREITHRTCSSFTFQSNVK
nr:MAG TPA: hypothetical protein [Caudoviricetes sp.]